MPSLQSTDKRKRAARIRQLAIGLTSHDSQELLNLAQELEEQADSEDVEKPGRDDPGCRPTNR